VVREVKLDSEITIRRLHNKRKRTPKPEKPSKGQKVENIDTGTNQNKYNEEG